MDYDNGIGRWETMFGPSPIGADVSDDARKQALWQALIMGGNRMAQPTFGGNALTAISNGLATMLGSYGMNIQDALRRKEEAENRKYRDLQMQMTQENIRSMIEARTAAAEERKERVKVAKKKEVEEENAPYYRAAMQRYLEEENLPEASFYAGGAGGSVQDDIIRKMISPEKKGKSRYRLAYNIKNPTDTIEVMGTDEESMVAPKGYTFNEPPRESGDKKQTTVDRIFSQYTSQMDKISRDHQSALLRIQLSQQGAFMEPDQVNKLINDALLEKQEREKRAAESYIKRLKGYGESDINIEKELENKSKLAPEERRTLKSGNTVRIKQAP